MKHPLLLAALLGLGLAACDDDGSATSPSGASASGSLVVDTVLGTWVSRGGVFDGDTVVITRDSMAFKRSTAGLYPTKLGVKFYASGGDMGLTSGQGLSSVYYEYLKSGDTLWLEMQDPSSHDGRVDRSLPLSFPLLPVR